MFQGENSSPNSSRYKAWADSMKKEYGPKAGQHPSRTEPYTIHRVPHSIRIVDEGAYEPKMLSIGPYHRSNPKLKAMEDRKWHSLQGVLRRSRRRRPPRGLSDYLKEMEDLEVQVRGFYSENEEIKRIKSKEFVEMMLLDGCFILELLLNPTGNANDPKWILPIIRLDMLLLENQLPFLVLRHLFEFVNGSDNSSLVRLAVQFFKDVMPINREVAPVDTFHHLLDLFHWHLLPETPGSSPDSSITVENVPEQSRSPPSIPSATEIQSTSRASIITVEEVPEQSQSPPFIPSATEIEYTRVKLRIKKGASSILDVEFIREDYLHVLKIPLLCINHSTNSIFRNLIAWEQCYPASRNDFTSYACFMDCLIDTPEDVVLLKRRGIIEHWLGNNEQVALLFNKMCMGITINFEGSFLCDLSDKAQQFHITPQSIWRARMIRDYFSDPLRAINLQFALMTIIFTFVQTALAVLSYKRPS